MLNLLKLPVLASLIVMLALMTGASARDFEDHPALAGLMERWEPLLEALHVPGFAIAVVDDSGTYIETYGHGDAEQSRPVDADTMFYIGSITKTYTATAILKLVEEGRVRLDDRVIDHMPRLKLSDKEIEQKMTIADLMTHRYGIDDNGPFVTLEAYTGELTDDRFYYWMERALVRGHVDYSNEHFDILGRLVETVTGMDWRDYLKKAVLDPMGQTRTTGYASILYGDANAAFPLLYTEAGFQVPPQLKTDRTMHPGGGLGVSIRDAAQYLKMHLDGGRLEGEAFLNPDHVALMQGMQVPYPEAEGTDFIETGRTLGWEMGTWMNAVPMVYHGGGFVGAANEYILLPEQDAAIALFMNSEGPAIGWLRLAIRDLLVRLTGVGSEDDLLAKLMEEIDAGTLRGGILIAPSPMAGSMPAMTADSLSIPAGQYTGAFQSRHLGTMTFTLEDGHLTLRLGEAPLPIEADGTDAFRITRFLRSSVRFNVEPNGEVNSLVLEGRFLGRHVFSRSGGH